VRRGPIGPMLPRGVGRSPDESDMPPPHGFEEIQRQELSRLFGRMVGVRLVVFVPLAMALALFVALAEPARWRALFLLALLVPIGTFFVTEALRVRRCSGFHPRAVFRNLLVAMAAQIGVAFATGALESPFTYTFIPLAVMVGLFSSPRIRWLLVGIQVCAVWALAALELLGALPDLNLAAFGGGHRAGHVDAHLVTTAALLSAILALAARAGQGVRGVFDAMLTRALRAQQESLRAYAERTEELTALPAEIAHELKNPLASVKGLSALLAENVPLGKGAERLTVLRREVDRMQGILEEFLNFSRPLVPLALGSVDLAVLVREVAALHEGMAHERGVGIEVRAASAEVRCDPRKVKQVLINLLQNALDASPPGARVEIEVCEPSGGAALLRLLDRGTGLDPSLGARIFDPGVTSKAHGSGLGLTIARALAHQHGGEVELSRRPGGGCAALLRLPTDPVPARAAEAAR
jgi:two-component system, NtrC family, sensor histidine kinase HydH